MYVLGILILNTVMFGLPQGSVLGPIKFAIYSLPIRDTIEKHKNNFLIYANDIQLYIPLNQPQINWYN